MSLENAVNILTKYSQHSIYNIPNNIKSEYKLISNAKQYNPELLTHYIKMQSIPTELVPGTIGAWLYGCLQCHYGEVKQNYSPLCLTAQCEYPVWIQCTEKGSNRFTLLNSDKNNNIHYVFVLRGFAHFTDIELAKFIDNRASALHVYLTRYRKHYLLYIHRLIKKANTIFGIHIPTQTSHVDSDYTLYIVISLFILIVLLLLSKNRFIYNY